MYIGVDLVKVTKFEKLKLNKTFMNKNFNIDELKYLEEKNNNTPTVAGLFASKEALLKSLKMGINDYSLKDIEIIHNNNGAPIIKLYNELYNKFNNYKFDLSISHDGSYVIATVICYLELI